MKYLKERLRMFEGTSSTGFNIHSDLTSKSNGFMNPAQTQNDFKFV